VTVVDGVPTTTSYREEILGADIVENVVLLGPGVSDTVNDPLVTATTSIVKSEQMLPDGILASKTVTTTSYQRPFEETNDKTPEVTYKFVEGTVEARTNVTEDTKVLEDGTTVKRRVSTTKFIKPIRVITRTDGIVTDSSLKEELIATEVDERITELAPGITEPFGSNVQMSTTEENSDEVTPDGKALKRKVTRVRVSIRSPSKQPTGRRLVTRKVRRIGPDGELIEDIVTEEDDDVRSPASSRRSSVSDAALLSPTESLSPSNSELDLTTFGVYADVVEGEPTVETDVQEFEDTLPDSTVVKKRVVTTTETKTVVMRALMPDDIAENENMVDEQLAPTSIVRYTDLTDEQPQTITDIYDSAEAQPGGEMMRKRVTTTGRRRLTTERKLISGRLDEPQFEGIGLSSTDREPPSASNRLEDVRTRRTDEHHSPFDSDVSSRLVLRKHVHKKTIIHGGKEETLVTETTHVEQDSNPPAGMGASIENVIRQFLATDSNFDGGVATTTAAAAAVSSDDPSQH
jgi:hypothetical protein